MDETYNSEDSYENRKRGREDMDHIAYPKRINFGTKAGHYLLKILVPPTTAGSIIGKGGAQIKELQSTYDVVIKLSQNTQFYPESNKYAPSERIVLVTGPPDQICKVSEFIHNLVRNPPASRESDALMGLTDPSRRLQMMKIVVTNTTAGMIIGKGGATVKSLNESYDVRIQASQKDDLVMGERIITVLGSEKGVNNALEYIIKEKLRDDPTSTSITNLDYSSYFMPQNTLVGSVGGIGSTTSLNYDSYDTSGQDMNQVNLIQTLLQQNQNQQSGSGQQQSSQSYNSYQSASSYNGGSSGGNSSFQQAYSAQNQQQSSQSQSGHDMGQQQNNSGANQAEVIARVLQALPSNALSNTSNLANTIMLIQALTGNNNSSNSNNSSNISQMGQQRMQQPMPPKQQLKAFVSRPDDVKFKVEIPDALVGRILGRQGATITEIQNTSGCEVKFSQRGEYVPGTQNRLLYICGQASGCKVAQQLIMSKIEGDAGDVSGSDFLFEQIPNN